MSRRQLRVGEKFVALRSTSSGDVTVDKEYTIAGRDQGGYAYFIDDVGDRNYAVEAPAGQLYPTGYRVVS